MRAVCPCGCLRSTEAPVWDKWVEIMDWGVISADDPRPASSAIEWYATRRCLDMVAERRLASELSAAVSGDANERIARGGVA